MSSLLLILLLCPGIIGVQILDQDYWKKSAFEDLKASLIVHHNKKVAKNVIIFLADGMGPNTATAARIYSKSETGYLSWERFPHIGALKIYSIDKQVPDLYSTGTTLFTGVKANHKTLGLDSSVQFQDCEASLNEENQLNTIAKNAQDSGKATGIVTTGRITHATAAAMYAHTPDKDWECDTKIPGYATRCKDIARQLIEDEPGKNFKVIMGGGRQQLKTNTDSTPNDPINREHRSCYREDGRDLIAEWTRGKELQGARYATPKNAAELMKIDTAKTDYILGIFQNDHFPYANTSLGVPSLEQMTETALKVLLNNKTGFLLLVETTLIAEAQQAGKVQVALNEVIELDKAVKSAMKLLEAARIKEDTLVIVTSDQSHTLTPSEYTKTRNNNLGTNDNSRLDKTPNTKLNTSSGDYKRQAATKLMENSHRGSDVFVYATGPYSHLFHRIHEQNYVAEVINYAARIGDHSHFHRARLQKASGSSNIVYSAILLFAVQLILILKQ